MIEITLAEFINYLCFAIAVYLLINVLYYLFAPVYGLSKVIRNLEFDYLGAIIMSVINKIILLLLIFPLLSLFYPVVLVIDWIAFSLGYTIPWSTQQAMLIVGTLFVIMTIVKILLNERHELENGNIEEVSSEDIGKNYIRNYYDSIAENLKGIKLYKINIGDDLTAYTYGGFLLPPRIFVSAPMLSESWSGCFKSVLLHEVNHIERNDIFMGLLLFTLNNLFYQILSVINRIIRLLSRLPILGIFFNFVTLVIDMVWKVWGGVQLIISAVSRRSEFFADTESFAKNPSYYLALGLNDISLNRVTPYSYIDSENYAKDLFKQTLHASRYMPMGWTDTIKHVFDKKKQLKEHPDNCERYYWAAVLSERMTGLLNNDGELIKRKSHYLFITFLFVLIFPVLGLISFELYKSYKYEFTQKDVIEYQQRLVQQLTKEP